MISKKIFAPDGSNTRFLSDFIIRSEQFTRVYNYVYNAGGVDGDVDPTTGLFIRVGGFPNSADIVTIDKWDLVDNSISFYVAPPAGSRVYIEVATTPEEFGSTLVQPSVERAEEAALAAEASAVAAKASEDAVAADLILTNADVVLTHADVVLTHADVVTTNADVVLTGLDVAATNADVVLTNADVVSTGLDVAATNADVVLTHADVVITNADVVTTNTNATNSQLRAWEAEAEKMTADSYATEAEDVFVKTYTSDGDSTFTATNTTEYSALHYSAKAENGLGLNPEVTTLQIGGEYISPYNMRNKLINGGFDIWQRGTIVGDGSTELDKEFLADRWECDDGSGGFSILSRQIASLTEDFKYFHRVDFPTRAATANAFMGQKIEGVGTLANKNITLSFKTKGTMSGTFTAYAQQNFGTGGTPSTQVTTVLGTFTIGATFTEKEFTTALPSIAGKTLGLDGDDYLQVYIAIPPNRLGQFDIAQVQLEEGSVATPFEQRPIGMELALCQRYYLRLARTIYVHGVTALGKTIYWSQQMILPVEMRNTPDVSYNYVDVDNMHGPDNVIATANTLECFCTTFIAATVSGATGEFSDIILSAEL